MIGIRHLNAIEVSGEEDCLASDGDMGVETILTIDDEAVIRASFRAHLEDCGFRVEEAGDGVAGIEAIEHIKPSLVLLDLQMPKMGGIEVLKRIHEKYSNLPVIVISGAGIIEEVVEALRLGAWDYLVKPIQDMAVFSHAIERALERASLIDEHHRYQQNLRQAVKDKTAELREHKENLEKLVKERTSDLERQIKEREQAERSLRVSESRFRDIVESASDWVWEMDHEFRFTFLSKQYEELSGFDGGAFIGHTREECFSDFGVENTESRFAELRRMLQRHVAFKSYEYEVTRPDGVHLVVRISGKPIFDENGEFRGYRGTGTDVSDLRAAQRQLQQTEKMAALGALVAGVSHEINTPVGIGVTAITHLSDQIRDFERLYRAEEASGDDLDEFLAESNQACSVVLSNLERAANLIQSFKQVAVDQSTESRRSFNLRDYIDETLLSLQPQIKKSTHSIEVECPRDIEMDSYPGAISQVITNLVMNTLLHGFIDQRGGHIGIKVTHQDNGVLMVYTDDGKGMDAHQLERLYDPFFTTSRHAGGTGLGMNIVYNLVHETLAGKIACHSEVGKGVRFTLSFPTESK